MHFILALAAFVTGVPQTSSSDSESPAPVHVQESELRKSVVNLTVTQERCLPTSPWKRESPDKIGGSGVVIAPGRILTNAHVVAEASEILMETSQTPLAVTAEVVAIDPSRDLALLKTDDPEFIAAHPSVPLFQGLPKDGSRVTVMGFPMGGDAMSTTSGVVSRAEWAEIGEFGEAGMRIQVDAAVNHGNSGGPAFGEGQIVGLAFSGMDQAEADNIAYLIATEEIQRFLDEADRGVVRGNAVSDERVQTMENQALRAKVGVAPVVNGVLVTSDASGAFQPWDVITKVNGYEVNNRGQVTIEGDRMVAYDCAIGRFVPGESASGFTAEIIRAGKPMTISVPALRHHGGVIGNPVDGNYSYLLYGPLAFTPLTGDLAAAVNGWMLREPGPALDGLFDRRSSGGKELIAVASPLLTHPTARGYEVLPGQTVRTVNGTEVKNFAEFVALLRDLKDEFVVFEFNERACERIVFRRAEVEPASERLMESNGIRRQCSKDVQAIWDKQ